METWNLKSDNFEILGVKINNMTVNFNLVIVYRRSQSEDQEKDWQEILKFKDNNDNTIIMGDFNAHHTIWNCANIDTNGERLHRVMLNKGYFCLNKDSISRLNYDNQTASNLDLIFANNNLTNITEYEQIDDTWGSDHYPIRISIDLTFQLYKKNQHTE